ncbi:MAG: hypothetical protein AAF471_08570 [Myxococcota bacterium]
MEWILLTTLAAGSFAQAKELGRWYGPRWLVVEQEAARVTSAYMKQSEDVLTVRQFWRGIGLLGGWVGRTSDGPLGWLRAWRGWRVFQLILMGAALAGQAASGAK